MEKNKYNLPKAIVSISIILATVTILIFTYFHVIMYPVLITFEYEEVMLIIGTILLTMFSFRYNMKYLKVLSIINILLGIFNLLGFNFVLFLFGW